MAGADTELAYASIADVGARIRRREVSPVELTELVLARIEEHNPALNAYYALFPEQVLAAARAAEQEIAAGSCRGPLHGIPICIKDIYESGPTTCGSKALDGYVAERDCTAVAKLKQAGALVLGKSATYEFATGYQVTDSHFGPTRNPWNPAYDAGGSSSGTGAAVAAGLAYAGMGSDTGGSIRWPAQVSLIVGLKGTYGRVSRAGVYPLAWTLDHTGPLARTVTDAALMLQGCAGYDPGDPASADVPAPDFTAKIGREIRGMKVGLPRALYEESCEPGLLQAFNAALAVFESLGAELVHVPSITLTQLQAVQWPIAFAEQAAIHQANVRRRGQDYSPHLRQFVQYGTLIPAAYYLSANRVRAQVLADQVRMLTEDVDVLALPTTGFQINKVFDRSPGLSLLSAVFSLYTPLFNLTGLPSIQVPCGFDQRGLPAGLQIAAKPFDEATVIQVAYAYEQAAGWHRRHPDL